MITKDVGRKWLSSHIFLFAHVYLKLSSLNHSYYALGETVGAFGIVFLHQAGSEGPGEGLIDASLDGTEKSLYELVRR